MLLISWDFEYVTLILSMQNIPVCFCSCSPSVVWSITMFSIWMWAQSGVFRALSRYASAGSGHGAGLHFHWIVGSELPSVCIPALVHESRHVCAVLCVHLACTSDYTVQTGHRKKICTRCAKISCITAQYFAICHVRDIKHSFICCQRNVLAWARS